MVVKYVDEVGAVIPPMRVYSQAAEPVLSIEHELAIWIDTDDSDKVYLVYRRGAGDQVMVELT